MGVLFLAGLTVLPGAWITFSLPFDEFSWKVRLALAVALSPAILAVQFLALELTGIEFAQTALILVVINVSAGFILLRHLHLPQELHLSPTTIFGTLLFLILAGALVLPWLIIPGYRLFSWHALLHSDVIYALTRNRLIPEEPELAGLTLAYDWAAAVYWSVLGWLSNWSPTAMYPATNLIWLLVAFVLAYEVAKTGLGLYRSTALFAVGLLFLGSQIIGVVVWLVANDAHRWEWILGTVNNSALFNMYLGFEDKPFVIALLLGLELVCLVSMQRQVRWLGVIISSLVIGVGLIYPIFFPMACLLAGGTIFLLASRWAKGLPYYKPSELLLLIGGLAVSIIVCMAFLELTTRDRAVPTLQLVQSGRWSRGLQVITTLLVFLVLAAPFIVRSFLNRDGSVMVLTATGFSLGALYVFIRLSQATNGAAEDKLIFGAAIALAPLAAAGCDGLFRRLNRAGWVLALVVTLVFASLNSLYMFRLGAGVPTNLVNAPQLSEESFWIALEPSEKDAAWTKAVRESTPTDTIVIALEPGIHLAPFLARSLYFPSDYDEHSIIAYTEAPAGYSVDKRFLFLQQRGYSEKIWDERLKLVESLYRETDSTRLAAILESLQELNRPLAIRFASQTVPALNWLRNENIGTEFFSDSTSIVWFIEPHTPLPSASR